MTRLSAFAALAALAWLAAPAAAQSLPENPLGAVIAPSALVTIWSAPPTAVLGEGPTARALANPAGGQTELHLVVPDKTAPQGLAVEQTPAATTPGLVVRDYVDVRQGTSLNRWLQVAPSAGPGTAGAKATAGWVNWGARPVSPDFRLLER